ncbi:hypothetical protein BDR03DRAFT_1093331 [Suillus americanus]|nr:hypothetical protein BDR03DRAFT_1093331 [Suillus americanus]
MAIQQFFASIFLLIFFIFPYGIVVIPSIIGHQTYGYSLMFTLVALIFTLVLGNVYCLSSSAPRYLGAINHSWGCASQLLNWVIIILYLCAISLLQVEVPLFPTFAILVVICPAIEYPYWAFVGHGKEKDHIQKYGEIHDWVVVKWSRLWEVSITGVLDCVVEVIAALRDLFPRRSPYLDLEETAGMEPPPPYSSSFHTCSESSSSWDLTVTPEAAKV